MSQSLSFEDRMRRLGKVHSRMYANGIVRKVGKDGLISAHPRRRMPRFPLKGFAILVGAAFLYKATLLAWLGDTVYQERVATLAGGSVVEQAGAWLMQVDGATSWLAGVIGPVLPTS